MAILGEIGRAAFLPIPVIRDAKIKTFALIYPKSVVSYLSRTS